MDFRHELKHEITQADLLALRSRLSAVLRQDRHTINGKYLIRSLYFDNLYDKALREKIDGVNMREKFRIRFYNGDTSYIMLEKKRKINGLCSKEQARLTQEEAQAIAQGDAKVIQNNPHYLVRELHQKMTTEGMMPKTIVDYTREPFVFPPGNVRITLDYDIRSGLQCTDFLNPQCLTVPVRDNPIVLEVKWDEYLPDMIRDLVQVPTTHATAFSKYAACRIYG
ncbi:MAG TPA: molecular chaperone [Ruminococcaceae bacterium]|nr:molecular chaperone [Oscillospiraceae bacterium]